MSKAQLDMFPVQHDLFPAEQVVYRADPDKVRLRLVSLLETARSAERMPWTERDARMWRVVFPQMANWLPDDEADQLRFEFAKELDRLLVAA